MARRKLDFSFGAKRVKPEEELESGLPRELRNRPKRRERRLAVKPSLLDYIRTASEVAQGLRPENIPMTGMRAGKQLGPAIGGGLSALYDYAQSTAPGQVVTDVLGAPVRFGEKVRENPAILAELIPGAGTVQGIREGAQRLAEGDPEAMRNAAALAALAGAMDVIPGGGKGANLAVRGAKELAEEGVDLGVKRAVSELTPSPQNTETLSRVGKVTFDQEKGVGQVPLNQNVNYRGFTAMMRPSKFLELASSLEKPNRSSVEHIKNSIEEGKGIGSPFLDLDFETGRVKGHEGRHRMLAIQEVQGDEPVPVHIFGRGEDRARHLASEDIESFRNKMTAQEGGTSSSNFSEAFHLGNVVPDLSVKPTESSLSVTKVPATATPIEEGVDLAARGAPSIVKNLSGTPEATAKDVLHLAANPKARADFSVWRGNTPLHSREGQLFDLSQLSETPNVPQFDLPRTIPPRGPSARIQDVIGNAEVQRRLNEAVERGLPMGGLEWYNTDPLRQGMINARGSSYDPSQYARFIDVISGTSPGLKVPDNIRTASYYNYLLEQGLPIPEKPAAGYGAKTQGSHVKHVRNVSSGSPWSVLENPKPPSFSQNLQGNWMPITADTHNFRAPGIFSADPRMLATSLQELVPPKRADRAVIEAAMRERHPNFTDLDMADFLSGLSEAKPKLVYRPQNWLKSGSISMDEALASPTYWASQPNPNEYGYYERWQQEQARKMGISPAQYQAGMWVGAGDVTGLGSPPEAFMRTVEDRILYTADQLGLPPEKVRDMILRGEIPMLATGGSVSSFSVKKSGR